MHDGLNKLGLPLKYAILCAGGALATVFIANLLGLNHSGMGYISTVITFGIAGAIGGWLRQRKGKKS